MFRHRTLVVLGLIAVKGAHSQVSTASVFPIVGPHGDTLQGEILGTGTDGTTFVLSGSPTNGLEAVTLTLIEDASHVSEVAVEATGSASIEFHVECGFDSASLGVCTLDERVFNGANATTVLMTQTGTVTFTPVLVSTSGATPTATSPSSGQSQSETQPQSQSQSQSQSTGASAGPSTPTSAAFKFTTSGVGISMSLLLALAMCASA